MYLQIFRLYFVTAIYQKVGLLVLVLAAVFPFVLPEVTNYHINEVVLEPARAQVAWQFGWLAVVSWLLFHSAQVGGEYARSGMGIYFSSSGASRGGQLSSLWGGAMCFGFLLCLIPAVITMGWARPGDSEEAKHWVVLIVQQFSLMAMVVSSLVWLAIAAGSRFGATIGYLVALGVGLWGFYGVKALEMLVLSKDSPLVDWLYVVSPHTFLADLTHRFVHKQGAMTSEHYLPVFEYVAGWSLLFAGLGLLIFTPKKRN